MITAQSVRVNGITATPANLTVARRLFWVVFVLSLVTTFVGRAWDTWWHTNNAFDGFFSPPHLFIYGTSMLNVMLLTILVAVPELRCWFGATIRLPVLTVELPGALVLVVGSYTLQTFGGLVLDNLWHTNFGLNETLWSMPHALIGWSRLVGLFGFIGCALALHRHRPLSRHSTLLFGFFIIGITATTLLGPFYVNNSPNTVRAIMQTPVLSAQSDFLDVYHIYLDRGLDRGSPVAIVLGAFWTGALFAFLIRLDRRPHVLFSAALIWTVFTAFGDYTALKSLTAYAAVPFQARDRLPLPLLPAVIVLLIGKPAPIRWLAAGCIFGLCSVLATGYSGQALIVVALSGIALPFGLWLGAWLYRQIDAPDRRGTLSILIGAGLIVPAALGLLDLYFRLNR